MKCRAHLGLMAVIALAACSSPTSSPDNAQTNQTAAPASQAAAPASPALTDADQRAIDAAVEAIYAPYRNAPADGPEADDADWDRPIFSAATKGLIEQWKSLRVEGEIVSTLEEAGWFCQCQDWSGSSFKFLGKTVNPLPDDGAESDIRFDLGDGHTLQAHILFVRDGAAWRVKDLFTPALPKGLVAQIKHDLATLSKP